MTRSLPKLRAYRQSLIDRRKKYIAAHKAVGGVQRELQYVTMKVIRAEMRAEKQRKMA